MVFQCVGLALGYGVFRMLRSMDDYEVEVLLTVAPLDDFRLLPALAAIPIVLLARFLSVLLPAWLPWLRRWFDGRTVKVPDAPLSASDGQHDGSRSSRR